MTARSEPAISLPRAEIQRAHDILVGVVLGEVLLDDPLASNPGLRGALDALCWVLRHTHNTAFATNLATIERECQDRGYVLLDRGRPMPGPDHI